MSANSITNQTIEQPTSESRKRGCLFYIKRGLLVLVILLVALPATGFTYETIMASGDTQRYPPVGRMVDVGGYKLHIHCVGEGTPTVVLMYGFADNSLGWSLVQEPISQQGKVRVCAYDRAGLGWSEPDPKPGARTPAEIAAELHALLTNANVPGPYILVGHSLGGIYVRMYTIQHPENVVGMVLVDARHESVDPDNPPKTEEELKQVPPMTPMYVWLVRLGVMRLLGPTLVGSLSPASKNLAPDTLQTYAALTGRLTAIQEWANEEAGQTQDNTVLRAKDKLGSLPLVVLASDRPFKANPQWKKAQEIMVGLSSNSRFDVVTDSDHLIQWDHPDRVIRSVLDVVEAVRTGTALTK